MARSFPVKWVGAKEYEKVGAVETNESAMRGATGGVLKEIVKQAVVGTTDSGVPG
jgi:hypothetical protein